MNIDLISRRLPVLLCLLAAVVLTGACQRNGESQSTESEAQAPSEPVAQEQAASATPGSESGAPDTGGRDIVQVTARDFAFEAPDELPSGWTTFRFHNEGAQTHFMVLYRIPEGKHLADVREVAPVFDNVMEALRSGDVDKAGAMQMLGEQAPPWFFQMVYYGGVGLTAPGHSAQATVNLDTPGVYIVECYVKAPNGMFHSSMGMQHELVITDEASGGMEPDADVDLSLSNDGIATEGALTPGSHTIRVHYTEDPPSGFPNDVHLARLSDDTDVEALKHWMDWMNVGGLRAPAPAEFIGGAENMPAGSVAYFTVSLEPGRYMWLSEVGAESNMASEFTVE